VRPIVEIARVEPAWTEGPSARRRPPRGPPAGRNAFAQQLIDPKHDAVLPTPAPEADRMAALFPPWSNTALRVALVALVAGGAAAVAAPMVLVRTPWRRGQLVDVDQPVAFDHRHHVRDDGIECRYCHSSAETSSTAGMPSTEVCMGCHSQVWNQSPMLEPVRRSWFSGAAIPWNRVHRVPDFVYFDHSVHVRGGIGCESCHGRVDEMPRVHQVASLTMGFCLDCHRAPERHLRPPSAVTQMGRPPSSEAAGLALARELGTRRLTHCTTCHR
jgi:predicted CXXCH cytochrome family protein